MHLGHAVVARESYAGSKNGEQPEEPSVHRIAGLRCTDEKNLWVTLEPRLVRTVVCA